MDYRVIQFIYHTIGTMAFMSYEIVCNEPHAQWTDYWSLGISMFYMFTEITPFERERDYAEQPNENQDQMMDRRERSITWRIQNTKPEHDPRIGADAWKLIKQLLNRSPSERLIGDTLRDHVYFNDIDWRKVENKNVAVEYISRPAKHQQLAKDPIGTEEDWESSDADMFNGKLQLHLQHFVAY